MTAEDSVDLIDLLGNQRKTLTSSHAVAAIIVVRGQGYLMQYRDAIPGIFYPGHWGLFGGALEPGEDEVTALRRELEEELRLDPTCYEPVLFFTNLFKYDFLNGESIYRTFYTIEIEPETMGTLSLGEGSSMEVLTWQQALDPERAVTPYDSFALWVHQNKNKITVKELT